MRWMLTLVALLQTAPLPPAYPRPGTTKLFENSRVVVWDIAWLKQQYPLHRHIYPLVGVYYSPGDRIIVSTEGNRRPVSTNAWDVPFQNAGVTHIEEGASEKPLKAVFIEMKDPAPQPADAIPAAPPAFPAGAGKQMTDNERTTAWEFVPPPAPGATHRHTFDAVTVAFSGTTPKVAFVTKGTVHTGEDAGGADRLYVFEIK